MDIAVVTGGCAGLGAVTAARLKERGFAVVVCDSDAEAVKRSRTQGFESHHFDIADRQALENMADEVLSRYGAVSVLVNNVGIRGDVGPFWEIDHEGWERSLSVNLIAAVRLMQRFLPGMMENRKGAIVNVSTVSVRTRPLHRAPYIISKAALEAATLSAAREVAPYGVRCNIVRPGMMDNERLRSVIADVARRENRPFDEVMEEQLRYVGMHRIVDMGDVADAIIYLADDTGRSVTGQIIEVDGDLSWER